MLLPRAAISSILLLHCLVGCDSPGTASCTSSRQCPGLVCDTARELCVECLDHADCGSDERCSPEQTCVPACTDDSACAPLGLICDEVASECVECVEDADCASGFECQAARCVDGDGSDAGADAGALDGGLAADGGLDPDGGGLDSGVGDSGAGGLDGGLDGGFDAGADGGLLDGGQLDGGTDACVATAEVCNGRDDDCNGEVDDGLVAPPCALTVGVCAGSVQACGGMLGWLACDASSYGPNYQATESTCDSLDNDCDTVEDEGCGCSVPAQDCGASEICACPALATSCSGTGVCRPLNGDYAVAIESGRLPPLNPAGEDWDIDVSAPDPYVVIGVDGVAIGTSAERANTYTPTWNPPAAFRGTLSTSSTIQFDAWDSDLIVDDFAFSCALNVTPTLLRGQSFLCTAGAQQQIRGRLVPYAP